MLLFLSNDVLNKTANEVIIVIEAYRPREIEDLDESVPFFGSRFKAILFFTVMKRREEGLRKSLLHFLKDASLQPMEV
ncbi:hypothetical protein AAG906_022244 [Vitis piasezkii]